MGYLIDGNNFLGQIVPYGLRDHRSRYLLVSQLLAFQKMKRSRVDLVFDGPPDRDLAEIHSRKKKFFVHFPSPGQKADDIIKERIARQTDFRQFFVVTSDRELKDFAKDKGAKTLNVREFASLLKKVLRDYRLSAELEKKATMLSPFEIGLWLNAFDKKNG